ncbi:hypothetical protein [Streptosporangium sp. NPDC023615]|uniref:hypothetical protein n=1 Tax=Streptosporangium sp. NPDC023615 TaxID=3154794 RepID=UPI00341FC947
MTTRPAGRPRTWPPGVRTVVNGVLVNGTLAAVVGVLHSEPSRLIDTLAGGRDPVAGLGGSP